MDPEEADLVATMGRPIMEAKKGEQGSCVHPTTSKSGNICMTHNPRVFPGITRQTVVEAESKQGIHPQGKPTLLPKTTRLTFLRAKVLRLCKIPRPVRMAKQLITSLKETVGIAIGREPTMSAISGPRYAKGN
jgi:hypothetical protein